MCGAHDLSQRLELRSSADTKKPKQEDSYPWK
jgi:hypothetical protein